MTVRTRFMPVDDDDDDDDEHADLISQPTQQREQPLTLQQLCWLTAKALCALASAVGCTLAVAFVMTRGRISLPASSARRQKLDAKRVAGSARTRVAIAIEGWIRTSVVDGGQSIRTNVIDALSRECDVAVFLSFTYDREDGCGGVAPTWRPHERCDVLRRLPALHSMSTDRGPDAAHRVLVQPVSLFGRRYFDMSPSLTTEGLLRTFEALPHWPALLAAHNAPGSKVACVPASAAASASNGTAARYECRGIYKGNSFLAPVLGGADIHNLHQLHALSRALRQIAAHEHGGDGTSWGRGGRFDRIIHTRLDLQWLRPHPPLRLLSAAAAWVPTGEDYYGGLNDRHAVLSRSAAEIYFGRWDALLDGSVMRIEPQLARGRVEHGAAMSNEHLLAATLRHARVPLRRFPAIAHLRCCDGKAMCFADGRYERPVPASLTEWSRPPGATVCTPSGCSLQEGGTPPWVVCGKYPSEVEMAVQHALALAVPGAALAAAEGGASEGLSYRTDGAPDVAGDAGLVIAAPVAQRDAFRLALERMKRRWYTVESPSVVWGDFGPPHDFGPPDFGPLALTGPHARLPRGRSVFVRRRRSARVYTDEEPFRSGPRPTAAAPGRPSAAAARPGYCAPTEDDQPGDCAEGFKGMWRMGPGHAIADVEGCARHCWRVCPRCRYVSASLAKRDCSWFSACDTDKLHLEWYGDRYTTVQVVPDYPNASLLL